MPTTLYLTDEPSDIAGYRRLKLGSRGDAPSLVRAVTSTEAGPSSGVQITRTAGGTALAWISDALDGTDLTAAAWVFHVWAKESDAAANAALRFQVLPYTTAEQAAALDDDGGVELTTTTADYARTSVVATITTLNDGDRLVLKVLVDDAGTLAAGHTVTVSYNGQTARAEGDSAVICPDTLAVTAALPAATRTRVRNILIDDSATEPSLTDAQVDQAFGAALKQYSDDRPRVAVALLSGDGSAYDFGLPAGWVWGLSRLLSVEHPAGEQRPVLLDAADVVIHESALGGQPVRVLRFLTTTPASGTDNVAVRYTTRHLHTDETDTVPVDDLDALCYLAASYAAETLAAWMAASSDSTIAADNVNHRNGSDIWRSVARSLRARYDAHLGKGEAANVAAAGATVDWDTNLSWGHDRLFHGKRWR